MFIPQMYKDLSIPYQIHKCYHLPLLIQKELDAGLTLVYSCRIINTLFSTVHAWISWEKKVCLDICRLPGFFTIYIHIYRCWCHKTGNRKVGNTYTYQIYHIVKVIWVFPFLNPIFIFDIIVRLWQMCQILRHSFLLTVECELAHCTVFILQRFHLCMS